MKELFYDLHLHSCLSPCGDADNTPNNLVGMAILCGLELVALTDHNTCKNCPAFFEAAKRVGIIPVAGMEVTTSEDIHAVCLFPTLNDAMRFDERIDTLRIKIKNRSEVLGEQIILDGEDNVIGYEEHFLPMATTVSIVELPKLCEEYSGVCYPAHIDRQANGIINILGTLPPTPSFTAVELKSPELIEEYRQKYDLSSKTIVVSSDAHFLTDMRDAENKISLDVCSDDHEEIRRALIKKLGGKL